MNLLDYLTQHDDYKAMKEVTKLHNKVKTKRLKKKTKKRLLNISSRLIHDTVDKAIERGLRLLQF